MTSEEVYYERGINLLHGFLTEYYVDDAEFIVRMPVGLKHLHVLAEPMSCATKAVQQAFEVQRRLRVWRPQVAYVMGAGQIGLLTTLVLRLRGLEVYTLARGEAAFAQSRDRRSDGRALHQHPADAARRAGRASRQGRPDHRRHRQQRHRVRLHAGAGPQRRAGLDQRHRRPPTRRSPLRQGESRLGAGQQAAARFGERQSRTFRDGHQGPGPGRSDVSRA